MKKLHTLSYASSFTLESGAVIENLTISYHTFGTYKPDSKVIWACHALTANSDVSDWWEGLFGANKLFDSEEYFVVCANCLGSCYGTTGPLSLDQNGKQYFLDFPQFTIRDLANAQDVLRKELGLSEIYLLIGASLGGQQAQEFAFLLQDSLKKLLLLATNAQHSPFGIAFNEAQRLAISTDPTFKQETENGGKDGLIAARSIAMLSYRSYSGFQETQKEEDSTKTDGFKAASYQKHQGEKLAKRFNAYSYWYLSKAMDSHNLGRNRGSCEQALQEIRAGTLVIGINSDLLFPISEQKFLAENIKNAEFEVIDSIFGHDGFLVETEKIKQLIVKFLNKK